jgi:NAD(P)-dependent dehydrogenase (short-subunit alcohol dehydrogenase family)
VSAGPKVILVTGAASGIGRETALLFARRGFAVVACDRDAAGLERLRAEVAGDGLVAEVLDVADLAAWRPLVARVAERFSRLDVLFNCAGLTYMGRFEDVTVEQHVRTVQVNVMGVVNGILACLDLLKGTPGAHVVTMGSASAFYGVPELSTYSASKFFVRGLTESLNLEFEKYGIVVTDLMPNYVATPMIAGQVYKAGTLETFGARLTPAEIAELVWKAAHARRVHWVPGLLLKSLSYIGAVLPPANKWTLKRLSRLS